MLRGRRHGVHHRPYKLNFVCLGMTVLYRLKRSLQIPAREFYATSVFAPEDVEFTELLP